MAVGDLTLNAVESYARRRTGIAEMTTDKSLSRRILAYKWTWAAVAVVLLSAVTITILIRDVMTTRTAQDGSKAPGLNADALWLCAGRAAPTLLFWAVCFVLVDRYRPQRLLIWLLAVVWGACVAVTGAYYLNSWVGAQMAVVDETSGVSAVRVAVFVAPFVEEGIKACAIFLIATIDRNRFTSRVSGAVIGGLVGAGFAFTENIIYYARVVVYGSYTSGTGDVMAYLDQMVLMRGVVTSFGHPLFTMMTGLGVAFGVTSRSKIVRVVAPAAGFLFAAFLHMFFNLWASVLTEEQLTPSLYIMVWIVVASVAIRLIISAVRQGRVVAARLEDYVVMGWLPDTYPRAFSTLRARAWTVFMSLWHGSVVRTWRLQVKVTQLAGLRESMTRGIVDEAGVSREVELLDQIKHLAASRGLVDGRGLRPYWPLKNVRWPWQRLRSGRKIASINATSGSAMKYSAVDPRWGPPA